jgi:hypothetical protein
MRRTSVTQYLLGMIQPDGDDKIPPPDVLERVMIDIGRIREELVSQGKWIFGNGLHGSSSTNLVRLEDGKTIVTDGPFVEMKEHLGGVTIIEVADREEALEWARRYVEVTTLPIEVRPFR